MSDFNFLHAADLHLDSPLLGLSAKSSEFSARVEEASRQAFDNLIDAAIAEDCAFVLLSGDVFDGDLRNMRAGLFLVSRLRRLKDAGIGVYMVLGNHDAENRFVSRLEWSDNVHVFSTRKAETFRLDDLGVAVHGRSFPQRDVTENLAQGYPAPVKGLLNIGVLHTACIGREGPHGKYAPCSVEQLVNHGYDYWALGHVHARAVLHEDPYVVYPGNLQGRHPRETGEKGGTIVRVRGGSISAVEPHAFDVVRWAQADIDLATVEDMSALLAHLRNRLAEEAARADGRALALRLTLGGETPLHHELRLSGDRLREDVATLCAGLGDQVWVEKLKIETTGPSDRSALDQSIAGALEKSVRATDRSALADRLEKRLLEISAKMPAGARMEELFERLREETPERAVESAAAILVGEDGSNAIS